MQSARIADLKGFTLIELSIVLVIIGLIVGGILVGQNLIDAAAIRAQVSQIEKYQAAANTFRGKYGYLPGDIKNPDAPNFGFASRGAQVGQGDGNALIESFDSVGDCNGSNGAPPSTGLAAFSGENGMFWVDLSAAHLIDGGFISATPTLSANGSGTITGPLINLYLPQAKIGGGNYVYAWSGGQMETGGNGNSTTGDMTNYFGLSTVLANADCFTSSNTALTVAQAYGIDKKIDDGLPQSGNVTATYPGFRGWAAGGSSSPAFGQGNQGDQGPNGPVTSISDIGNHMPAGPTSCYDGGSQGNPTLPEQYSMGQNNGAGANCALSFRFQ